MKNLRDVRRLDKKISCRDDLVDSSKTSQNKKDKKKTYEKGQGSNTTVAQPFGTDKENLKLYVIIHYKLK